MRTRRSRAVLRCGYTVVCAMVGLLVHIAVAHCSVAAIDATGVRVTLARPAMRVIALAPHLTEMVYEVGGGARLIAVSDFSDFPSKARSLPRVGDAFSANRESLLALKPDLVLVWQSGGGNAVAKALRQLNVAVYVSEPTLLDDVAKEMQAIAQLLGLTSGGADAATHYRATLRHALVQAPRRPAPRVFLQVGAPTLYTVTDGQFLGQALRYCGGVNVFGALAGKAPIVGLEAVIVAQPQRILQLDDENPRDAVPWQRFGLPQPARLPSALLGRPGPRFADGVVQLCRAVRG